MIGQRRSRGDCACAAAQPAGSGPGAAAAEGPGLAGALHAAPALLAAIAAAARSLGGSSPSPTLRRVSKACCEAVDAAATRMRLDFPRARQQADEAVGTTGHRARWLARGMARRLAKLPCLVELVCSGSTVTELEQLLAGLAAARVQRLEVHLSPQVCKRRALCSAQHGCLSGRSGPQAAGASPCAV
jgi:hypothetical protein